jgi:hypothetical protein
MGDHLRLYIHESAAERCVAKGLHRSGARVRQISFNDALYGSESETPCGVVTSVVTERIDRENWLYRVEYIPAHGTPHPIDSFVVWRQPVMNQQPIIPQSVAERVRPEQVIAVASPANGSKRNKRTKKQSVNGQHGGLAQASADHITATV